MIRLTAAKHGRFLVLDNDWYIGRLLLRDGEYCEGEVELFTRIVGKDDVVVEAGANVGAHTVPLSRMARSVVAWEPQPHIYHVLCGNLALNGCHNVQAYPAGLGAATGHLSPPRLDYDELFNFGGVPLRETWDAAHSGRSFEAADPVAVYALDQLGLTSLRLLKADVEGMEEDVVRGAAATIERCRPFLYLEDTEDGNARLYATVEAMRYRVIKHQLPLIGPRDALNPYPGYTIVSKNILCVPSEMNNP